jgi:hypothetical protein
MVGAHLERLFAPHNKTNLMRFLVLQQSRLARPAFLPFVPIRVKSEEFCTPERERKVIKGIVPSKSIQLESAGMGTYNLKTMVSSSSLVFVTTSSVSLMTGSKWGSCSSSV